MKLLVLLRGINVSGRNIIKMDSLRQVLADAGFFGVQTYIQSGNIILDADSPTEVKSRIQALIREHWNLEIPAIVLSKDELQQAISRNPFDGDPQSYLTFFDTVPDAAAQRAFPFEKYLPDDIRIDGRIGYIRYATGSTKLTNAVIEKKLGVCTSRNLRTCTTLLGMLC